MQEYKLLRLHTQDTHGKQVNKLKGCNINENMHMSQHEHCQEEGEKISKKKLMIETKETGEDKTSQFKPSNTETSSDKERNYY